MLQVKRVKLIGVEMKLHVVASVLLICVAHAAAVRDGPRLRETALAPATNAVRLGSQLDESPERVAGYFRLDRTYAAEMFYFYFQACKQMQSCCCSQTYRSHAAWQLADRVRM